MDASTVHHISCHCADYMVDHLSFNPEGIADACAELYGTYGTTLAGLVVSFVPMP